MKNIIFFLVILFPTLVLGQTEMIVFEHVGGSHSKILSSVTFKEKVNKTKILRGKIISTDSVQEHVYERLDSLVKSLTPNAVMLKDSTKYGSYKVTSYDKKGKIKYSYYVNAIDNSISYFELLRKFAKSINDASLYTKFDNHIYYLEIDSPRKNK